MEKPIFLVGFMGVGKTTIGKKLASSLEVSFVDVDEEIEKELGKSINQVFSEHGEAYFRNLEQEWLQHFNRKKVVVATGGGMPCDMARLSLMKDLGIIIYLERPVKELFVRLKNAKKKRPLISVFSDDELLAFIEEKLAQRSFYYNQADIIVNRENQNIDKIISLLKEIK